MKKPTTVHRKNMPQPEVSEIPTPLEVCDQWRDLFLELGRTLGMKHGNGEDVMAEVKRLVSALKASQSGNLTLAKRVDELRADLSAHAESLNDIADALDLPTGHSPADAVAGARNLAAAFDVAKSALEIVRKERDNALSKLEIAEQSRRHLSNAIRNAAAVEANEMKP